ncbi:MAG TPA: NUDIX hydrolase, partial [Burkholderiaceae bacterium]|nr:NUDIX hydrolase [Burkholderiaceae bacterium]
RIELQDLYTVIDVVPAGQVHMFYRAQLQDTQFAPGPESIEARLFTEDAIPWDEIAFRTVRETLKYFFADRRRGVFELHCGAIG